MCHSSKFVEATPLPDKAAESVAEFLFRDVFARYGMVRYMLTDRGREFPNGISDALAEKLGVSKRCTSAYHPQANGVAERTIGVVSDRLAKCSQDAGAEWPSRLPAALMALRTSVNFSTGYAPLELLTGREFVTPMYAELNGIYDIEPEEVAAAGASQEAADKAAGNEQMEYDCFVQNYERICNPKLPFFLDDEDDVGFPKGDAKRPRVSSDAAASQHYGATGMTRKYWARQGDDNFGDDGDGSKTSHWRCEPSIACVLAWR